ncbi:CopK family periplasmic copper-binding protein [Cupriavidus necator]
MKRDLVFALLFAVPCLSALSAGKDDVLKTYELKDGSFVHVMKNGTIVMQDPFGHDMHMKDGMVMETKDGFKLIVKDNQVFLNDSVQKERKRGQ